MSERNVKLFYNEMCKNEKLQNEIKEVLGVVKTESDKQALLNDIAKKYNFDFTPEETKKFAENLSKNKLSLDDLSEVSGGIGRRTAILAFTAITALGSLGSAGAIVSHAAPPEDGKTQSSSTDKPKEENDKKGENDSKNYIVIDDSIYEIDTESTNNPNNTTTLEANGVKEEEIKQENDTTKTTPANKDDITNKKMKMKIKKNECLKKGVEDLDYKLKKTNKGYNQITNSINTTNQNGADISNTNTQKEEERKRKEKEKEKKEKLKKLNSKIINKDNIDEIEDLACPTDNLNLVYRMTRDGANTEAMQNKIKGHSNILVLVKTNEGKIFGGYTSCRIEYDDITKKYNKSFLFSTNLTESCRRYDFAPNEIEIFELDDNEIFEKESEMKVQELFNSANNNTASKDSEGSQVKKLAENLEFLYQIHKKDHKDYGDNIMNLFKKSEYKWYYYKIDKFLNPNNGSYYLLENKKCSNDRYYLTQKYSSSNDCKVIYYKEEKYFFRHKTEYLNNADLEKQLHQRRLFRNALQEIESYAKNKRDKGMKAWANSLKNKIMPDKPASLDAEIFYK